MKKEELKRILDLHAEWLRNSNQGSRADLSGADLSRADLRGADLRDAVLSGADLRGADLSGADLRGAVLSRADLSGADLSRADLSGADLSGADLRGAVLRDAVLSGAVLSGAILRDADLRGAVLRGVKIKSLRVYTGLYFYEIWSCVSIDNVPYIRMGCLYKTVEEWDRITIRSSNLSEFPNNGSEKSEERVRAFEFARTQVLIDAEK
jgi:uncharacterized protein YjbI with pentapeptide repeats